MLKEKRLTQEGLARKTDIPYTTLSKIGGYVIKKPSINTTQKIAKGLETSIDKLSGYSQLPHKNYKKYLLFTPGPVNVEKNVRIAICKEDICHREEDFDLLLQSIEEKILKLFLITYMAPLAHLAS